MKIHNQAIRRSSSWQTSAASSVGQRLPLPLPQRRAPAPAAAVTARNPLPGGQPNRVSVRCAQAKKFEKTKSDISLTTMEELMNLKPGDTPVSWCPNRHPSTEALEIWQNADAVCFDLDMTLAKEDGLEGLAVFMGVGDEYAALVEKEQAGSVTFDESLDERLLLLNIKPDDIKRYLKANPPATRINEGAHRLITALKARGIEVYLLTSGFRELLMPVAKFLGIPSSNVIANKMNWQWDDESGEPTKLVGFDMTDPVSKSQGKPEAIAKLRERFPYNSIVMVGDGVTDLEAVQASEGADLFIGYGGNIQRSQVMAEADWFVFSHDELYAALKRRKVAMVGAGAMACAAMHVMGQNLNNQDAAEIFDPVVKMWLHDSEYEGKMLSETITETKTNPKYLPGVSLGEHTIACPNLFEAVKDADIIVFCVPHQFIHGMCKKLIGKVREDAIAISLTKGMRVTAGPQGTQLVSQMIRKMLGIDCSVLMGANIASEIGKEWLTEAVIGYYSRDNAKIFQKLFERDYFVCTLLPDAPGAEMCGTLKNLVAIGAGMIDGLGYGSNSKAAIMRMGLQEIRKFSKALYPTIRDETFLETCGIADLIATCYGGRNRLCAEEWARAQMAGTPKTFEEVEKELLNGQKLQGCLTANEVHEIIAMRGWELEYPLFTTVYRIISGKLPATMILNPKEGAKMKLGGEIAVVSVADRKRRNPLPSEDLY